MGSTGPSTAKRLTPGRLPAFLTGQGTSLHTLCRVPRPCPDDHVLTWPGALETHWEYLKLRRVHQGWAGHTQVPHWGADQPITHSALRGPWQAAAACDVIGSPDDLLHIARGPGQLWSLRSLLCSSTVQLCLPRGPLPRKRSKFALLRQGIDLPIILQ